MAKKPKKAKAVKAKVKPKKAKAVKAKVKPKKAKAVKAKVKTKKTRPAPAEPKVRIGWFSYSCCEDSTIVLTEIMNDHWQDFKKTFEFVHARVLQARNRWEPMDVAFIEGAVADEHQAEEIRKIRGLAKKVVAIGACACTGMPSAQRNLFGEQQKQAVQFLIEKFKASPKVRKLAEVIKVDAEVPGCPMDPKNFLAAVTKLVAELKGAR